jgi:DNA polymerase-1
MPESCYLVDAFSLIYQVFHAIPGMTGPKGQPTNAVFGFTGDMLRLRKRKPDFLLVVFDPPGKTFRDTLYADYKANRPPPPDELQSQFPVIRRMLETLNIPCLEVQGFEADDVLATLATQAEHQGMDVFLVTGDKDCRQLISDRVKVYNVRKDMVFDTTALQADWGIAPHQVIDYLALVGDSVDNVKGVPGVGPKTATKLLQESGNIEGIFAAIEKMKPGKVRDNLAGSREVVGLGRKLITLARDVPLETPWEEWRLGQPDLAAFLALCQECGFHRYANEMREEQKLTVPPAVAAPRQGELFPDAASADAWKGVYHLIDTPAKFDAFLAELKKQRRFVIDLEATGPTPMLADIIGYAFCWTEGEAYYLPVRGPKGQPTLDPARTLEALRPVLESPDAAKFNHNVKYDLLVLRRAGVNVQGVAGDSMIADYLLAAGERDRSLDDLSLKRLGHTPRPITELIGKGKNTKRLDEVDTARVAKYAAENADVAFRLCARLEPELKHQNLDTLYRDLEVPLVEVLAEMEHNGIRIDVPLLQSFSADFADRLGKLENEIYGLAGRRFNIGSFDQLRQILFDELRLPALRKTSVTKKESTRQEVLDELAALGHELPKRILEYRQIAKLKSTYVDALPLLVNPDTGRIHASFNQTVASTGRLSSSDPNLQNIPIRSELGEQIRQAFVAGEPGGVLLTADYSQIELRVLAHLSGDEALRQAFAQDRDIHAAVAAHVFGVREDAVDKEQRRIAKVVNFGVIYGLSAFGLAKTLGLSKEEATAFIDQYFAKYAGVARFQQELLDNCRRDGYVNTILGRRRAIEGIRPESSYWQRNRPEREALNTVIQGSAADLIKQAMLNIHRRLRRERLVARMLLQIHDELVFDVPTNERDAVARLAAEEMTSALPLSVPLKVDLAAGPNWLETEPLT